MNKQLGEFHAGVELAYADFSLGVTARQFCVAAKGTLDLATAKRYANQRAIGGEMRRDGRRAHIICSLDRLHIAHQYGKSGAGRAGNALEMVHIRFHMALSH